VAALSNLKVFLAGRIVVESDAVVIDESRFPGRQGRLLFAYLAAEQGRPVPRDKLADALWGHTPPATWEKALTVLVSKLRGLLGELGMDGATALTGAFGCYRLDLAAGTWVDVAAAGGAAEEAEAALAAGHLEAARAAASLAVSIARQPLLAGEEGEWVEQKRRELAEVHTRGLDALSAACLRSGDPLEAARWAKQAVALEPFRETGYRHLMLAHSAAGNRAEALRVYDRCRRLLADELGAYPSSETESVYRALLDEPKPPAPNAGTAASGPRLAPTGRPPRRALIAVSASLVVVAAACAAALTTRGGGGVTTSPDSLVEIDAATRKIDRVIHVGRNPGEVAVVGPWVFVTSVNYGTLYRVARRNGAFTISGRYSAGRTLARQGDAVWVPSANDSLMRLVDADSLRESSQVTIPIPSFGFPGVLTTATVGGRSVWVADLGNHSVSRWQLPRTGSAPKLARRYPLGPFDWPVGAAFGARAAWFPLGEPADAVLRIDATTGVSKRIPVGKWPTQPAFGFGSVWVPMFADDTVWRLNPLTGTPEAIIKVGRGPFDVAVGGSSMWVTDHCDGTVERIDPSTDKIVASVHTGFHPQWLAAAGGSVWVGIAAAGEAGWPCGADHSA
jgi:SARP family transcriptional regulator, regulator of embCAB operon